MILQKYNEKIRRNLKQILTLVEKNFFLEIRFKGSLFKNYITPFVQIFINLLIFGTFFTFNSSAGLGYWNSNNFTLFMLIAINIQYTRLILDYFQVYFRNEKFWKTLQSLLVSPINRFTMLLGVLFSKLFLISLPLVIFTVISFILYPIPLIFFLLYIIIFFIITLIFACVGLIIGVFVISNENISTFIIPALSTILYFSCISYPLEIFGDFQFIILLNPFYYLFDFLRLTWMLGLNFDQAISLITPMHIIILILVTILMPIISIKLFNRVYNKFGITGY